MHAEQGIALAAEITALQERIARLEQRLSKTTQERDLALRSADKYRQRMRGWQDGAVESADAFVCHTEELAQENAKLRDELEQERDKARMWDTKLFSEEEHEAIATRKLIRKLGGQITCIEAELVKLKNENAKLRAEKRRPVDVGVSEWARLRRLLDVPHEHYDYEGMNECHICDRSLVTNAADEIEKLRDELAEIEATTVPSGQYLDVVAQCDKLSAELERRRPLEEE